MRDEGARKLAGDLSGLEGMAHAPKIIALGLSADIAAAVRVRRASRRRPGRSGPVAGRAAGRAPARRRRGTDRPSR